MTSSGFVSIVGAGPGDPELITVRALRRLRQADVVAYDRLIDPALLDEAPPLAERINVGKAPGRAAFTQEEINALLIGQARQDKRVVRLKGGDPFVFGRGSEECQALAHASIPFEVVPGVSSATAVPAFAGIPVTHRKLARSFTVITGHTTGSDTTDLDWRALARLDTLVFLMGVANLGVISRQLIQHGRDPETATAVIRCGSTEQQAVVVATLATIAERAQAIRPPATVVIGPVVALRQEIDWFQPEPTAVMDFLFDPVFGRNHQAAITPDSPLEVLVS
jgi:uroporphyrin-III C-methyltransferase